MKKPVNVVGRMTSVVTAIAAVAAVGLSVNSTAVKADPNWPTKPVTIVVPFPAGGGTDAFARPLFTMMNKQMNKQFILDYRGGAGGTLGAGIAAKAAPDGYTFFMGAVHHAIAPSMYPIMLVRSDNSCLCSDCARKQAKTLISDLRSGYETTLKYICMVDTSDTIYCDGCSLGVSAYE